MKLKSRSSKIELATEVDSIDTSGVSVAEILFGGYNPEF